MTITSLSTTFSCTTIAARRRQIPCPEMVNQWPHLVPIANSLTPYQHNVEVGLLIGSNCPRAIMPRKIIPGNDNEPYAQKTDLGWGIVGNVSRSNLERDKDHEEMHTTHACIELYCAVQMTQINPIGRHASSQLKPLRRKY